MVRDQDGCEAVPSTAPTLGHQPAFQNRRVVQCHMCFSPQADLVSGVVIGVIGIDCLRHVRNRRHDHLAFAALPLLFGLHQLTEAFVWWGLRGEFSSDWTQVATWVYLLFAFVVLPVYVPAAIRALEPPGARRQAMNVFLAIGAVVSAVLLVAMIRGPVVARLGDHHLEYSANLAAGLLISVAYVAATCGAAVFAGYRHIAVFGVVNLIAVGVIAHLAIDGFASLWCGWAAVTSIAIAWHLRRTSEDRTVAQALS